MSIGRVSSKNQRRSSEMGRQIQFYMTYEDEIAFIDHARSTGEVRLLAGTSEVESAPFFNYPHQLGGRKLGETCYLWNGSISPKPKVDYISEQGLYCIDHLQSEVVSFWRSKIRGNEISVGRLHIEDTYLDATGNLGKKGEAFIAWYNTLSSWLRSTFQRGSDGVCTGPGARYQFAQGLTPAGPLI